MSEPQPLPSGPIAGEVVVTTSPETLAARDRAGRVATAQDLAARLREALASIDLYQSPSQEPATAANVIGGHLDVVDRYLASLWAQALHRLAAAPLTAIICTPDQEPTP